MKSLIYYKEGEDIGVRKHMFDWKPGHSIITDGDETTVYAVFENNDNNNALVKALFKVLNSTRVVTNALCQKSFSTHSLPT